MSLSNVILPQHSILTVNIIIARVHSTVHIVQFSLSKIFISGVSLERRVIIVVDLLSMVWEAELEAEITPNTKIRITSLVKKLDSYGNMSLN